MKSIFKSLAGNTLIFAIGNGVTLIIAFIMVPFYTKVLSPSDFGISDIIVTTTSMLLPLVSLNIFAAIFRFALDKESNRETLFTNGLNVTLIGIAASIFVSGILEAFGLSYALLVGLYLSATLLLNFFQNFVRGIEHVKTFALSGIIATATNVASNLLLMWVFKLGLNGYLFSLLISTLVTVIFLAIVEKLHRYVKWTSKSWTETKALLKYSIPMIPNSFAWWLTNDANKIIILMFMGPGANGILAVANKIPTMLSTFFGMFANAWQMTAVEEDGKASTSELHRVVFTLVFGFLITGCAVIVLFIKPFMSIYVDPKFFSAWTIVPILLLTSVFSNMSAFFGTTYFVAKKTAGLITTTLWGMLANIALSFALVPVIGLNGAGVSGSLGFLLVTILRYRQTQKFVPVKVNWSLLSAFIVLYGIVSILTLTNQPVFYGGVVVFAMLALLVKALPHTAKVALKGKLKLKTN